MSSEMVPVSGDSLDLLGITSLDPESVEAIAARRKAASIHVAGLLYLKDVQFMQQQSEAIATYFDTFRSKLPKADVQYHVKRKVNPIEPYKLVFKSLKAIIHSSRIGDQEDESRTIADIAFTRSGTIWLPSKANKVFEAQTRDCDNKETSKNMASLQGKITYPYTMIGRKPIDSAEDDVLLMPLSPNSQNMRYQPNKNVIAEKLVDPRYVYITDRARLVFLPRLLVARCGKTAVDALLDAQDVLLDNSLSVDELQQAFDPNTSQLTLAAINGLAHIRMYPTLNPARRFIAKRRTAQDVIKHGLHVSSIKPIDEVSLTDFLSFDVLKQSQRTAALMDRSEGFDRVVNDLARNSPAGNGNTLLQQAIDTI